MTDQDRQASLQAWGQTGGGRENSPSYHRPYLARCHPPASGNRQPTRHPCRLGRLATARQPREYQRPNGGRAGALHHSGRRPGPPSCRPRCTGWKRCRYCPRGLPWKSLLGPATCCPTRHPGRLPRCYATLLGRGLKSRIARPVVHYIRKTARLTSSYAPARFHCMLICLCQPGGTGPIISPRPPGCFCSCLCRD